MTPSKKKIENLEKKMLALGVSRSDIVEKFIHSSGKGGQNVNKVSTCVFLHHVPTGLRIKCSSQRTQGLNRFFALRRLLEKIDELENKRRSENQRKIEKIKRQKRKRTKRAKEKILKTKRERAEIKQNRKPPGSSDY